MPSITQVTTVTPRINSNLKFRRGVVPAFRDFTASHPWKGTRDERKAKLRSLHSALCRVYGLSISLVFIGDAYGGDTNKPSRYEPVTHTIYVGRKLSVLTYLHQFSKARNAKARRPATDPIVVREWAVTLFSRVYGQRTAEMIARAHASRNILKCPTHRATCR